uniref:Putative secreted protein n=1 Tax=Anopheles darlingi TaxID=43151 RepID=A0A2M4D8D7_ANODA
MEKSMAPSASSMSLLSVSLYLLRVRVCISTYLCNYARYQMLCVRTGVCVHLCVQVYVMWKSIEKQYDFPKLFDLFCPDNSPFSHYRCICMYMINNIPL